jgi:uncharacterized protein
MFFTEFEVIAPYSPWLSNLEGAFVQLPSFRRDVFEAIYTDVTTLPQMVSVTGPRRVGKTTLLQQCIQKIIADAPDPAAQARRIVYFSMQDPLLDFPGFNQDKFFNDLMAAAVLASREGTTYLFLDEIQRFPRWELYLKKYYDLKTPVRMVVSGSASTPIFKKSRESLLGRIKDFHVLPFSFREYLTCQLYVEDKNDKGLSLSYEKNKHHLAHAKSIIKIAQSTKALGFFISNNLDPKSTVEELDSFISNSETFKIWSDLTQILPMYFSEGGFPEVWALPTQLAKQEYLYQNQVERVIFEDLLLAAEFRKPEMLRRFYLGLLKDPGRETNLTQLSKSIELSRSTIESYFPLLEATDLVWRLHKHTSTKATPKAGNFKTYLVDLAVRNAVMKLSQEQMVADPALMGAYAENVVANHLRRWPGLVELGYWRVHTGKAHDEIDFIVDLGHTRIAIEVKYRNEVQHKDVLKAARLAQAHGCEACIVVSKESMPNDEIDQLRKAAPLPLAVVPLAAFLMLF